MSMQRVCKISKWKIYCKDSVGYTFDLNVFEEFLLAKSTTKILTLQKKTVSILLPFLKYFLKIGK